MNWNLWAAVVGSAYLFYDVHRYGVSDNPVFESVQFKYRMFIVIAVSLNLLIGVL